MKHGPFHRRESPTQTPKDALVQVASGEIWGKAARGSDLPAVKAYNGGLPPGERGINFETAVAPHHLGTPFESKWYLNLTAGVLHRMKDGIDFAAIPADIKNLQP